MKTNELRLNNWIYPDKNIFPMQVEAVGDTYVYCDFDGNEGDAWEADLDKMLGIPLTEELLLKCGFEKSGLPRGDMRFMYKKQSVVFCVCFFAEPDRLPEVKFGMMSREINSLHQLQNLFHSLTGEELEIKL